MLPFERWQNRRDPAEPESTNVGFQELVKGVRAKARRCQLARFVFSQIKRVKIHRCQEHEHHSPLHRASLGHQLSAIKFCTPPRL